MVIVIIISIVSIIAVVSVASRLSVDFGEALVGIDDELDRSHRNRCASGIDVISRN